MSVTESHETGVLVTKREAADALGVSIRTIDRYIADGTLVGRRISPRTTRVLSSSLNALLQPTEAAS